PPAAFAARAATTTIPTLFIVSQDPVSLGLVSSLARPDGNLTGINLFNTELAAKRLSLLHELVPRAVRVAVLAGTAFEIEVLNADNSGGINAAFEKIESLRPDALFVAASPVLTGRYVQLVQLAAFYRLPASYALREAAEVGGLMSYGTDIADAYRQIGIYTGRILKGAKPADLPVVQASKFELVINVQTARMLGLTVPDKLLVAADEVIE